MLLFFKSFIDTFSTLSWVDIVFFLAVIFLIILVVTLIYFIIINDNEEEHPQVVPHEAKEKEKKVQIFEDTDEEPELMDLKTLTKKLEEKEITPISMNDYEEEQEQKAIISYDELKQKQKNLEINYEEEQQMGDLTIKKVDMDTISSASEPKEDKRPITMGYEKEEAFLEALKKLQEQIN